MAAAQQVAGSQVGTGHGVAARGQAPSTAVVDRRASAQPFGMPLLQRQGRGQGPEAVAATGGAGGRQQVPGPPAAVVAAATAALVSRHISAPPFGMPLLAVGAAATAATAGQQLRKPGVGQALQCVGGAGGREGEQPTGAGAGM